MAIGILGRKVGMTQIFDEAGKSLPVTAIEAGPCTVLAVRNDFSDHGIIVRRHGVVVINMRIHPDTRSTRLVVLGDCAW